MLERITPFIITYNEIDNIKRTLRALTWAKKILVVDSFSTDGTVEYCRQQTNVELIQRKFDNFAGHCNFALAQLYEEDWVLSLDADYVLTDQLVLEIKALTPSPNIAGFKTGFTYAINGKTLRGSLYPPRVILYQRKLAHYQQDGHAHRVCIDGDIETLDGKVVHDDRKSHQRWLTSQYGYAQKERQKFANTTFGNLSWPDKIRRVPGLALVLVVPYLLFAKGLLFSGRPGVIYIKQRFQAEWILQKVLLKKSS
jgi:glycosyltransferase involved in cell wall biosynthesis